ncbi:hypothetical protein B0H16DRAFT_164636 [Mycena metata]|uniref:Uncharacterized protein n=1 Tax=Mycena metata TaxID=1033252 RepID=A0AAD7I269_9AGAR|nr:hypothetical protein B0H16DRAFT_164636 [Mycena metata]
MNGSVHRRPESQKDSVDPQETLHRREEDCVEKESTEPSIFTATSGSANHSFALMSHQMEEICAQESNHPEIPDSPLTPIVDGAQQDLEMPAVDLGNEQVVVNYPLTDPVVNPPPNPPTVEQSFEEPLKPHPCCLPHPESMLARGISCITRVFLVDFLPPTYTFLPYRTSHSTTLKFQIPFFIFSGPDPPPPELGSPGDLYVAPATNALYACMAVAGADGGGGAGSGVWMPWRAIGYSEAKPRDFKLTDPGLLLHPYFPAHVLWTFKACFGWYSIVTLNNWRRDTKLRMLVKGHEEAGEAAKVLVAQTLQLQQEKAALAADRKGEKGKKKGVKRRVSTVEDEEEEGESAGEADDYEPKKKKAREEANAAVVNNFSIAQQARRAGAFGARKRRLVGLHLALSLDGDHIGIPTAGLHTPICPRTSTGACDHSIRARDRTRRCTCARE